MRRDIADRTQWHQWFAWHPVVMEKHWVWLESIERRWDPNTNLVAVWMDDPGEYEGGWEYKNLAGQQPTTGEG